MYLVAGLGNPGKQYEATRHNMGFDTIDYLIEEYKVPQGGVKFNAMYGKTMIGGEKVILMKPLLYELKRRSHPGYGQLFQDRSGNRTDRDLRRY